jgi:23S rRNA pseudouridine1911/1915/1917 synthase
MNKQVSKTIEFNISPEQAGNRLDRLLAEQVTEYSRSSLQRLIKDGMVSLNGSVCTVPRTLLASGDLLRLEIPPEKSLEIQAEDIDLEIIFEDESMLVINKPPGMVVHPAAGNWSGTVVNALLGRDENFQDNLKNSDNFRPGIVHRLDKDTSGCLIIAKNESSMFKLAKAFADRQTSKTYAALVRGCPSPAKQQITTLIGRHPVSRKKMAVVERNGKEAVTVYNTLKTGRLHDISVSFLEVKILTGRTHQIRVHMAHCKTPILGDVVYGGKQPFEVPRQMLHAWKLSIPHPVSGEIVSFEAPIPPDFQSLLDSLK